MRLLPRRRTPAAPRERIEPTVAMPKRQPVKISISALAASLARPAPEEPKQNPWQLPTYRKGVLPNGATQLAMDEDTKQIVVNAWDFHSAVHGLFAEGIGFMGYPYLAELSQRAEYRRASEVIAEEMTRKWVSLKATGEDDKSDKIKALGAHLDRFRVRDIFRVALEHDGFFGLGMIFMDFGDDSRDELMTRLPIRAEKVGRGRLKGLRVIDPTWVAPFEYNSRDPTSPAFYKPQTWIVMGKQIHATRLLTLISRPLPDILKPAYNFGGLSLSQMLKPYVDNWLRTRQSVSDLINAFTIFNLATNLEGLMGGAGGEEENKRLEWFSNTRNNRGLLVSDKETEELKNISAPLGTLDHLQAQAQEHMASVAAIPLVKLLGVTPSGLNASADGEIRTFYDGIKAKQEKVCSDPLRTILQVLQLDLWGEVDDEIDFEWVPLWELDEAAIAAVRKTEADTDAVLIEVGAIDPDEVRLRIASEPDSQYAGLDLTKPAPGPPTPAGGEEGGEMPFGKPQIGGGETTGEDQTGLGETILAALRQGGVSDTVGMAVLEAMGIPSTGAGDPTGQAVLEALKPSEHDDGGDPVGEAVAEALA